MDKQRCQWVTDSELYRSYHDNEWGIPIDNSQALFAMLMLEGQQAGLSWLTVLKRRETYFAAYANFCPQVIAQFGEQEVEDILLDPGVIRQRKKVEAIIQNAKSYVAMEKEGVNFSEFVWGFVNGEPIINEWEDHSSVPVSTPVSQLMSAALKERGFQFVGPIICYAFMQAVGMVNDHTLDCGWRNA